MKGYQFDEKINAWDLPYYMNQVEQRKFAVDKDKLIEYFPLDVVTEGLFGIYQELLGLTFTEVEQADVWHENVKLYSARDTETGEEIGQFYLDLHPRLQPDCDISPGKENMATQVALGSSLAAEALMESAGYRLQPWWQTSPSPGKIVLLSSNTMKWRPIFMSLVMSCTKSAQIPLFQNSAEQWWRQTLWRCRLKCLRTGFGKRSL